MDWIDQQLVSHHAGDSTQHRYLLPFYRQVLCHLCIARSRSGSSLDHQARNGEVDKSSNTPASIFCCCALAIAFCLVASSACSGWIGSTTGKEAGERVACFLCFPTSLEVILGHAPVSDFASGGLHHAFLCVPAIYIWPLYLLFLAVDFAFGLKLNLSYVSAKPAAVSLSFFRCLSFVYTCKAPRAF